MSSKDNGKKLEKYWFEKYYLKLSALIGYCIEPIQISPSNQYWNDKKSVVKIPLVLLNSGLGFISPN